MKTVIPFFFSFSISELYFNSKYAIYIPSNIFMPLRKYSLTLQWEFFSIFFRRPEIISPSSDFPLRQHCISAHLQSASTSVRFVCVSLTEPLFQRLWLHQSSASVIFIHLFSEQDESPHCWCQIPGSPSGIFVTHCEKVTGYPRWFLSHSSRGKLWITVHERNKVMIK